jgi:hypothetical protein
MMRRFMICITHQFFSGSTFEKNEMGWTCGVCGIGGAYRILVGKSE